MSPAPHVAVTVTGLMGQSSTDLRESFRLSDLRAFCLRPTRQSGGLTLENGLGVVATPGILCKRKERALGLKSVWRPSKQPIRLGDASSRRCFRRLSGPGHLPAMTGPFPPPRPPRSLLRPGAPSDARCTLCGAPSEGGGGRGCRGPGSRRGPGSWNFQETAEINPGVVFPQDSRVTVHSWALCCRHYVRAPPRVKSPSSGLRVNLLSFPLGL